MQMINALSVKDASPTCHWVPSCSKLRGVTCRMCRSALLWRTANLKPGFLRAIAE